MDAYLATGIAEGFEEAEDEEQVIEAWQFLVDTGMAWQLQGWFGRQAASMIEAGVLDPPARRPYNPDAERAADRKRNAVFTDYHAKR